MAMIIEVRKLMDGKKQIKGEISIKNITKIIAEHKIKTGKNRKYQEKIVKMKEKKENQNTKKRQYMKKSENT